MNPVSRSVFLDIVSGKAHTASSGIANQTPPDLDESKKTGIHPYTGVWGKEQILHLLRRSLFGVTQADYNFFSKLTLNESLDVLLTQSPTPPPPVNTYNDNKYTDPDVPFGETWVSCPHADIGEVDVRRIHSLWAWWIGLMLNQDRSLTEKMTLFWHNHLAASFNFIDDSRSSYNYLAPLRLRALDNFKKLVFDITTCTGMLQYLGGYQSRAAAPNENYSRELQELFTIGKGPGSHYTQDDVVAAARLLTGWTNDDTGLKTIFKPEWHDSGDKQFSAFYNNTVIKGKTGQAGATETMELIDMIFNQREAARYTCRCLYRWFVNAPVDDTIEASVIEPLADILIQNKYEISPVLRALLGSGHFFDTGNMGCQSKNPVDFLIGLCRQFNVTSYPNNIAMQYWAWKTIAVKLESLAMQPGYPPNVAGWPAYYQSPGYYKLWINSDTIVKRFNITDSLFAPWGLVYDSNGPVLHFDVINFTAQLSNPADIDQLIIDSTSLLSALPFDKTQIAFMKNLLLSWPDYKRSWTPTLTTMLLSWKTPEHAWRDTWMAFAGNPTDISAKNKVIKRLSIYYTYLVQQAECHLI